MELTRGEWAVIVLCVGVYVAMLTGGVVRAIIIEEARFSEVIDLMRKRATELHENAYLAQRCGLSPDQIKFAADEMFRAINYEFVRWAQSHGASCTK